MTAAEVLALLRSANSDKNIGLKREKFVKAHEEFPEGLHHTEEIAAEAMRLLRSLERATREEAAADREPRCLCGHEHGWHRNGLLCERTGCECAVFRTKGDQPLPRRAAKPSPRRTDADIVGSRFLLPARTQDELLDADIREDERRMAHAHPPNPWEELLSKKKMSDSTAPSTTDLPPVQKLAPGESRHLARERRKPNMEERVAIRRQELLRARQNRRKS